MVSAIEAVNGGMSMLWAATLYVVPRTTLQDCVKWRVNHGDKPGPNTYLTSTEEEELASVLMEVSKIGYGMAIGYGCVLCWLHQCSRES